MSAETSSTKLSSQIIEEYLVKAEEILDHPFEHKNDGDEASEIISKFLWVGNRKDAQKKAKLKKLGITHVLNCAANQIINIDYKDLNIITYKINASDSETYDLIGLHATESIQFINKGNGERQ